jgi:hypothetical protein
MDIEVYCDEAHPDLFSSQKPKVKYMIIGGLWLKGDDRDRFKKELYQLKNRHRIGGEFKWRKVSPSRLEFYNALVTWFYDKGDDLRFRCIAVDHNHVNLVKFHENDQELGFYKFYYQMLHHWIHDFNSYAVFCDFKSNRRRDRLHVLHRCLHYSNLAANIAYVQAIRSEESILIQLTDVLIGVASSRMNKSLTATGTKSVVVDQLEGLLGHRIGPTALSEKKFNVFRINLNGVW